MHPRSEPDDVDALASGNLWTPSTEPTVLLVGDALERTTFGWQLGGKLQAMPTVPGHMPDARSVLAPGGRVMLMPLVHGDPFAGHVPGGVARVDLRTGESAVAAFTIPSVDKFGYGFGGSPDGQKVAINTMWKEGEIDWSVTPPQLPTMYTGLYVATFDGSPARVLEVLADHRPRGEADDIPVQWSPDGSRVAWSVSPRKGRTETRIYDVEQERETLRVEGTMCGSASWGPESDCLLVNVGLEVTWLHDLMTDTRRAVTVLPPRGDLDLRPVRALGLADRDHIVTIRHTDLRVSISVMDLTSGDSQELLGYSRVEARYPVIAAMPRGTWTA